MLRRHRGYIAILCVQSALCQEALRPLQREQETPVTVEGTTSPNTRAPKLSDELRDRAKSGASVRLLLALTQQIGSDKTASIRRASSAEIRAFDEQTRRVQPTDRYGIEVRRTAAAQRDKLTIAQRTTIAAQAKIEYAAQQVRVSELVTRLGGRVIDTFVVANIVYAEVPGSAVEELAANPEIAGVYEDEMKRLNLALTTKVLGAPVLWDAGYRGGTQTVAVIDTGISSSHSGFAGVNIEAYQQIEAAKQSGCFASASPAGDDTEDHGTHVAGIIASQGNSSGPDIIGVAPGVGRLVSIQVGAKGTGIKSCPESVIFTADVLKALQFAVLESAARVINLSLGASTSIDDKLENWVIDKMIDDYDVTVVIAAGNAGESGSSFQLGDLALSPNALTVANLDPNRTLTKSDDTIARSSSNGPTPKGRRKPDLASPGTNVTSLAPGNQFKTLSGTSMAAPHIAGAAALLYDAGVTGHKEVKALLLNSTLAAGWSRSAGWGAADLAAAYTQRQAVESSSVRGASARYFRVPVESRLRSTLVWNRHIASISPDGNNAFGDFRDLNLEVFDENTNRSLDSSTSKIDNVEQVGIAGQGLAIVKVSNVSTNDKDEAFALAFSTSVHQEISPARLKVQCESSKEVSATMKATVSCTAENIGGLPLYGATAKVAAPTGFGTTAIPSVARVNAGERFSFRSDLSTPGNVRGLIDYKIVVEYVSFGEKLQEIVPMSLNVRAPKPQDCTMVVTPASETLLLTYLAQAFTLKIEFPRFAPSEPGFCSYEAWETGAWFSLSGRKAGQGDGEFVVNVTQAGKNSIFASRTGQFRLNSGVDFLFHQSYAK